MLVLGADVDFERAVAVEVGEANGMLEARGVGVDEGFFHTLVRRVGPAISADVRTLLRTLMFLVGATGVTSVVMAFLVTRFINRPIQALRAAAARACCRAKPVRRLRSGAAPGSAALAPKTLLAAAGKCSVWLVSGLTELARILRGLSNSFH